MFVCARVRTIGARSKDMAGAAGEIVWFGYHCVFVRLYLLGNRGISLHKQMYPESVHIYICKYMSLPLV